MKEYLIVCSVCLSPWMLIILWNRILRPAIVHHKQSRLKRQLFWKAHPPISDEEFIKRCSDGVRPDVALRVREVISDVACIDKEFIYPHMRFIEDLELY